MHFCIYEILDSNYEVRKFDDKLLEEIFVINANLSRRQLEDYSRGKMVLKLKDKFIELGKKRKSEGGEKGENQDGIVM
jgi:hypothetical protein